MAEYEMTRQNRPSRVIANCEVRSRQMKSFIDNRYNRTMDAIQLKPSRINTDFGSFTYELNKFSSDKGNYLDLRELYNNRVPQKSTIGVSMTLAFVPGPKAKYSLNTEKIGFIQIIKKTNDINSEILGNSMADYKSKMYRLYRHELFRNQCWARIIRTASNGYRIDSQSNTPYYGSDRCSEFESTDTSLPGEKIKLLNNKENKKMELGYYYKYTGCCGERIKKKNAVMFDAPRSFVDEFSKSEFETRAFDMINNICLGGIKWGYEVKAPNGVEVLPVEEIQDAEKGNYNGAVDQWNTLKMAIPFSMRGQVLSPSGEPALGSASTEPKDFCPIFQVGKI